MNEWVSIIVAGIALTGSVTGGYFVYRANRKGDAESNRLAVRKEEREGRDQLIDHLQEELKRAVARIDLVDAHAENRVRDAEKRAAERIAAVEQEQARSKRREHIRDDYINELRNHIETGQGPPAPPWPKTLYEF